MLFDLSGKRKRLVQVVYATLAALFLVGFVGFGIGGSGAGGLLDGLGLGGDGGGSVSSQFDDQINAANQQLAKDPKDTDALKKLALNEYLKGRQGVTQDPTTGEISVSEDAHTELGKAADAWNTYVRLNKGKPDPTVASQVTSAFYFLNDFAGAAETQRIVAENDPNAGTYGQLAYFEYGSGNLAGGDAAAKKAESLASGEQKKQLTKQFATIRKEVVKAKKQQAKAAKNAPPPTTPGANPLQGPLGGAGTAP